MDPYNKFGCQVIASHKSDAVRINEIAALGFKFSDQPNQSYSFVVSCSLEQVEPQETSPP